MEVGLQVARWSGVQQNMQRIHHSKMPCNKNFHKIAKISNNGNIGITGFCETKKII